MVFKDWIFFICFAIPSFVYRAAVSRSLSRAIGHIVLALVSCTAMAAAITFILHIAKPAVFVLPQKITDAAADPDTNLIFFGDFHLDKAVMDF